MVQIHFIEQLFMKLYPIIRSLLFRLDAERAHGVTLALLEGTRRLTGDRPSPFPGKPVRVMGLEFPNRIGLAAGLDKNGEHVDALGTLGFGFIEVGTVTPRPQPGNPRPRLFRIPEAHAIINRMGFNNKGVDYLVEQVKRARFRGVLGINIGKNADTPLERAGEDYLHCMRKVYPHAGYIALNISSPNTPGLRQLQQREALIALIEPLKEEQDRLHARHGTYVPLAVKVAPDLDEPAIDTLAEVLQACSVDALIATNTTLDHRPVHSFPHGKESGGLSGAPLRCRATAVIERFFQRLGDSLPIIGVGGVTTAADAVEKRLAGAALVQIYSGLIYNGPTLVHEAATALAEDTDL